MQGRKILLIVGGGIAAYKACELVRLIRKAGGSVRCVLTAGGAQFITPMTLVSGVFFPLEQLPAALRGVAAVLPLTHAIELARPLLLGRLPANAGLHLAVLAGYGVAAFWLALALTRRRLTR